MKRSILFVMALILLLPANAFAGKEYCWYYAQNGIHDFEQTDIQLPSCTTDGYYRLECRQCGLNETIITEHAFGHNWEIIDKVQASCEEKGYVKYECVECHKTKTESISALGHDMLDAEVLEIATCSTEGSMRTKCARCGRIGSRVINKTGHTYGEWIINTAATDHSMGERSSSCTVCGKKKSEQFYPEGTLYRGMQKNEDVVTLQQMLIELGYLNDKADGIFGKKTEKAVIDYQKYALLDETGIAYPQTIHEIAVTYDSCMENLDDPTPSPTEQPADSSEIPLYCMRYINEDGLEHVCYCEAHQLILDTYRVLSEKAENDDMRLHFLTQECQSWQLEVNRLFNVLIDTANEENKPEMLSAKAGFYMMVAGRENVWNQFYKNQPLLIAQKKCELFMNECIDLCTMVNMQSTVASNL